MQKCEEASYGEKEIEKLCSPEILKQYKNLTINKLVALDKRKFWCPTTDCNTVLKAPACSCKN